MNDTTGAVAAAPATLRDALTALWSVLFGSVLNGFAAGALSVLIGVRLAASGEAATVVGVVLSCHFIGLIVGCRLAPQFIVAIGHVRAFAVFTALATCLTLALALVEALPAWGALRFGTGLCMAGTFTVIESWLNQQVSSDVRGRVFAAYMIAGTGAAALAPLSLGVLDPFGHQLFLVVAMGFALAPLGMMLRLPRVPVVEGRTPLGLRALLAISPGGLVACFGHGLVNSALFQVAPVYFERLGFDTGRLAAFLSVATFAGVLMQVPVGMLADRVGRHWLLLGLTLLTGLAAAPLALLAAPSFVLVVAAGAAVAAFAQPFYSLGVGIANDRLAGRDFVSAAGGLLLVWAAGSVAGPVISAALIDLIGPLGLYVHVAATSLVLAAVVVHRMIVRPLPIPAGPPPAAPVS